MKKQKMAEDLKEFNARRKWFYFVPLFNGISIFLLFFN